MLISKCVIHTLLERIPNNHELLASMKLHLTLFVAYADTYEKIWNSIWWNSANTATKNRINEKLNRLAFDAATSLFDAIALFDDYCDLMDKNSIPSSGWAELACLSFKDAVDTLEKEHSREINSIQLPLFK